MKLKKKSLPSGKKSAEALPVGAGMGTEVGIPDALQVFMILLEVGQVLRVLAGLLFDQTGVFVFHGYQPAQMRTERSFELGICPGKRLMRQRDFLLHLLLACLNLLHFLPIGPANGLALSLGEGEPGFKQPGNIPVHAHDPGCDSVIN